jgi:hypothetical protein
MMPTCSPLSRARLGAIAALGLLFAVQTAVAQPQLDSALPSPRLYTVLPHGGKVGTVVEVSFAGVDLDDPDAMRFNHPGIKAEPIKPDVPPPDPKKPADPKKPTPPPPQVTKFKVTIGAEVPVGFYDLRLVNKWGVSNPRTFAVGDLTEVQEKEPNNDVDQAQRVELNSTINGSMVNPTDVDYYAFPGKKGQRVIFSCLASSIDSRFHPGMEIYDAKGKMLGSNRNYNDRDALTDITLPDDGDYFVRLFSFTHTQGNAEHFYRLSISTGPWIDAIHPCVVEPGKENTLTVYGRNLPGGKLDKGSVVDGRELEKITVKVNVPNDPATLLRLAVNGATDPKGSGLDGFEYRVKNGAMTSNSFLLTYARAPLVLDNEQTRTSDTPQMITLPCEIAGRIEKRRDRDWYAFTAKKGDIFNIEVLSDRLGGQALMYFKLVNAETKADIFESQDNQDTFAQKFYARSEDPLPYRFTVPADGKYLLLISSRLADTIAGPRHYYRARITPEQPDFRLVAVPYCNTRQEGATLHQGGHMALTVYAWRNDGFGGDITLSAEGLPAGVTCAPQTIAGSQKHAQLVLTAADNAAAWTGDIKIKGTATIRGQKFEREARTGSIVWQLQQPQQLSPTISRLDRSFVMAVRDKAPYRIDTTIDKASVVQGDKATLKFKLTRNWPDLKGNITIVSQIQGQQGEYPQGLLQGQVNLTGAEGTMTVNVGNNIPPGTYNLVLRSQTQMAYNKDPMAKQKPNVNIIEPTGPVTLTILPKSVAQVTLNNQNPTVKLGAETPIVVKANRQFGYDGEFKVQVVLPPGTAGIAIADAVIPAGKDEATLIVKAAPNATPGNRQNLTVKVVATVNGNVPIPHEVKFAVNVVK